MKEKNLKKILSIVGIVFVAVYLLFFLITTSANLLTSYHLSGLTVLSNVWSILKAIVLYGFVGFYFIYELVKKSDKHDKVINIILFVVLCILALSSLISMFKTISAFVAFISYGNAIIIIRYLIDILNCMIRIGAFVLLGINTMRIVLNKNKNNKLSKILTIVIVGLLVLAFVNSSISTIINLIRIFNIKNLLLSMGYLINGFSLSAFQSCLAYVIYKKLTTNKE